MIGIPLPERVLILGALSAIAVATARRLAAEGCALTLIARDAEGLAREAADLGVRGALSVHSMAMDLTETGNADAILASASSSMGGLDAVLIFYGVLGDQRHAEADPVEAQRIIDVNFTSAAQWALAAARHLEANASDGVLVAISSVAGDRGRRSNYVYGAAKAGLSVLMQGLAHKWDGMKNAPRAITMRLGFIDTPMTDGLPKGGPLWAKPDQIARSVEKAMRGGGPTVYAPWFWRWIMLAIRLTPHFVFKKVNL